MKSIVVLTQARKALSEAKTLKDIAGIHDVAKAAEAYAKAAHLGEEMVNEAIEVRLWAERKAGEMLAQMEKNTGARGIGTSAVPDGNRTLADLGVTKKESSLWQLIARVPLRRFQDYITETREDGRRLSAAPLAREVERHNRVKDRERQAKEAPRASLWSGEWQAGQVCQADATAPGFARSLPEASVDMVMTDPPWSEEALPTFEALGAIACRVLKPGGFCATYVGHMFLPEVYHILTQHLDYVWTFGIFQPDSNTKIVRWHLFDAWRPIILLKKPGEHADMPWIPDAMRCTRSKSHHPWEQGIEPAMNLINAYTVKGELVLDPFVGSGTSLLASKRLKRLYVGFDVDEATARLAGQRVADA
jgi:hypothetical protein